MTARLSRIDLAGSGERAPPPEVEQEQLVAVFDLLEENSFAPVDAPTGPYCLTLGLDGGTLSFDLRTEGGAAAATFAVSLGPLRQIVKDYREICASYYEAVRCKPPSEIETLDEARRAIHGEGAAALQERLIAHAAIDDPTAKRLFTLLYALSVEG